MLDSNPQNRALTFTFIQIFPTSRSSFQCTRRRSKYHLFPDRRYSYHLGAAQRFFGIVEGVACFGGIQPKCYAGVRKALGGRQPARVHLLKRIIRHIGIAGDACPETERIGLSVAACFRVVLPVPIVVDARLFRKALAGDLQVVRRTRCSGGPINCHQANLWVSDKLGMQIDFAKFPTRGNPKDDVR